MIPPETYRDLKEKQVNNVNNKLNALKLARNILIGAGLGSLSGLGMSSIAYAIGGKPKFLYDAVNSGWFGRDLKNIVDYSLPLYANSPVTTSLNRLGLLAGAIVGGGYAANRYLKRLRNRNIQFQNTLNPNTQGVIPSQYYDDLYERKPVSRVTGHVRYNGAIVRPHLRNNPIYG